MGNKSLLSEGRKHDNTAAQESIMSTWEPETQQKSKGVQQIRLWQASMLQCGKQRCTQEYLWL